MNTRNRFVAAVGAALLVGVLLGVQTTQPDDDTELKKLTHAVAARVGKQYLDAIEAADKRSPFAVAAPAGGFVFVLQPDGRASIVKADGIVVPVVSEFTLGLSPYTKVMLKQKNPDGTSTMYRAFDFRMGALSFDHDLDVDEAAIHQHERRKERAKEKATP